jgi:type IV secretory pathway VirB2 component (pilin)
MFWTFVTVALVAVVAVVVLGVADLAGARFTKNGFARAGAVLLLVIVALIAFVVTSGSR